ncbi:unnamed protein product [Allacma fusca]|uniref:Uncharacterized protein n=1 Tax=Allacma fusca TaxID=39272 RepID=A0A8J2MDM0_9HEXA|nr:unnamed protein product [Allacma fusca]
MKIGTLIIPGSFKVKESTEEESSSSTSFFGRVTLLPSEVHILQNWLLVDIPKETIKKNSLKRLKVQKKILIQEERNC